MPEEYAQPIVDNAENFLSNDEVPKWVQNPEYVTSSYEDDGKPKIARNVWSIQRLTELAPSKQNPWRKIFRFTAEEFWGIFYADGTPVPGQPFYRRVYKGMRGMISDQGRLMIVYPQIPSPPPFKPGKIIETCLNTVRAIINEFYKRKYEVSLKFRKGENKRKKVDLWEYLGVETPEVVKALAEIPPKKPNPKKFRVKPVKKYYPKYLPANVRPKKFKSKLSYDMLPPDSYKAKLRAKKIEKELNAETPVSIEVPITPEVATAND